MRPPSNSASSAPAPRRRWHASTWLAGLVALGALTFVNLPGRLVTRGDWYADGAAPWAQPEFRFLERYRHGWPCEYLQRLAEEELPLGANTRPSCWELTHDVQAFSAAALALDVLVAFAATALLMALAERWRRRRNAVWQLHLADLLALTLGIALLLGWYVRERQAHERDAQSLAALQAAELGRSAGGGYQVYGYHTQTGPAWLRESWGEDASSLERIVGLTFSFGLPRDVGEFQRLEMLELMHLDAVPDLAPLEGKPCEFLEVWCYYPGADLPGQRLDWMPRLPRLRFLSLGCGRLSPDALRANPTVEGLRLAGKIAPETFAAIGELERLRSLEIVFAKAIPDNVAVLADLPRLHTLIISDAEITADQLRRVAQLSQVRELRLRNCSLTELGLAQLARMVHLRKLDLHHAHNARVANGKENFARQGIDAAGLAHLTKLTNLEMLDITPCEIPIEILGKHLRQLPLLRHLSIELTDEQKAELAPLLPDCAIDTRRDGLF